MIEALEHYVSPEAAAIMHAPFAFGDTTEAIKTSLEQVGFPDIAIHFDVRVVRFPFAAALDVCFISSWPVSCLPPPFAKGGTASMSFPDVVHIWLRTMDTGTGFTKWTLVQYYAAGSPLASHLAQVDDAVREHVLHDISTVMQPYIDDHGLAFPIEGHLATARTSRTLRQQTDW